MKVVAVSEFKSKLAKYLRLVKTGEEIDIRDRGIPVAVLSAVKSASPVKFTPPRKDPARLAQMHFSVKLAPNIDVVNFLLEDRKRR
ncbi:MAG: type II toxin-antitoxin system Phd/YefM family antitoxin [Bdellovibrionia bacterium]